MKLTEMLASAIIKKGVINEARNVKLELDIPDLKGKVTIMIEHMTTKFEKERD